MAVHDSACQLRAKVHDDEDESRLVEVSELAGISKEIRVQWIEKIAKCMKSESYSETVRPWEFVVSLDGSVAGCNPILDEGENSSRMYPAHYRTPPGSIDPIDRRQRVKCRERFAFASLLYEIWFLRKPFAELNDEEVQQRHGNAEFPDDIVDRPSRLFIEILSNWSVEFDNKGMSQLLHQPRTNALTVAVNGPMAKVRSHIEAHPVLFAAQVAGTVVGTTALFGPAILGALGFGVLGPVAGSVAAGWQGRMGAVQAGSFFAWCQSAAMGGAAVNGVIVAGAAGGRIAAIATAGAVGRDEAKGLLGLFGEGYRRSGASLLD